MYARGMTDKPRFIGTDPAVPDDVLSKYKAGVAERAARQRDAKPKTPNLAVANEQYKPGKDVPMTLAQMGEAQRAVEPSSPTPGLSPATVAGLKAMADLARASQPKDATMPPAVAAQPAAPPSGAVATKPAPTPDLTPEDLKRKQVNDKLSELDDLDFDRVMRGIQNDVINNDTEREAVKSRVKPIDLVEGLQSGEFTQDVAINSGLTVRFRTVSPMENQAIRLLLFQWVDKDPRKDAISAELYGLMLSVASIIRINTNELPRHIKGATAYDFEFDEDTFTKKYHLISTYPMPLIHAIGVHGAWFDQRVRALFTSENLKNG